MSHLQAFIHVGWLALGFLNHQQYQPIPGDSFQALPPLIGQKSQGQPPLGWMYKTLRKQCGLVPLTTNLNWVTVAGFPKHVTLYHLYKMLSCVVGKRWIYLWWPETRLPLLWLPACRYIVRLNVRTSWRVWTLGWLMMNPYTSLVPIRIGSWDPFQIGWLFMAYKWGWNFNHLHCKRSHSDRWNIPMESIGNTSSIRVHHFLY